MKIFCQKADLNRAINNVSHSIPTRTTTKILEGILAEVTPMTLTLTATDTNITTETYIPVSCDETLSFVIPARLFSSIVSKLPEDEVMLDYDDQKSKLRIRSGNFHADIICFRADDFPKIRNFESEGKILLPKETVKKLIKKTAFAASTDELNGVLTGVLMEIEENGVKMVGVDTFRMAIYESEAEAGANERVIIPARLINKIEKVISDDNSEDMMSIEIADKKVIFKFDNNKITVNTLEGNFIDYNRIIRKESLIEVRVVREDLMRAIDRASILTSSQNNNLIKLEITDESLKINSLSDEGNIEESVEVIKDGDDLIIGFNSRYIMDILKVIDDDEIILYMRDSVSPCIIKSLDGAGYLYLILPVRIN